MSNVTITDTVQFEEIINSLENSYNKIKDVAKNENKNKEQINGNDIWVGNAQNAMYNKYTILSNNFEKVDYSLRVYIKFLKKTLEDYELENKYISKNIDSIADNLDVNS